MEHPRWSRVAPSPGDYARDSNCRLQAELFVYHSRYAINPQPAARCGASPMLGIGMWLSAKALMMLRGIAAAKLMGWGDEDARPKLTLAVRDLVTLLQRPYFGGYSPDRYRMRLRKASEPFSFCSLLRTSAQFR